MQVPTPIATNSGESERSLPEALTTPVSSGSLAVPSRLSARHLLLLSPSADLHTAAYSLWAKTLSSKGQLGDIWRGRHRRPGVAVRGTFKWLDDAGTSYGVNMPSAAPTPPCPLYCALLSSQCLPCEPYHTSRAEKASSPWA